MAERDLIEIRVAPCAELIATVRAVATAVAALVNFDVDAVSDVRMAVDEACNQVARHADPTGSLRVEFRFDRSAGDGCVHVVVSAPTQPERCTIDTGGLGSRVLSVLADEFATEHATGPDGDEITVRLVMRSPQGGRHPGQL